jgi:hypothetical protein
MKSISQIFRTNRELLDEPEVQELVDYTRELEGLVMDKKIEVIKAYKTQFYNPESSEPSTPISGEEFFDFLKGRMMTLGRPAGMNYAEGFTINRIVGVKDLFGLS